MSINYIHRENPFKMNKWVIMHDLAPIVGWNYRESEFEIKLKKCSSILGE